LILYLLLKLNLRHFSFPHHHRDTGFGTFFSLDLLTIGDRIARPATIHWHMNVWRGGNMAKTQPDRLAIKRLLSLLGSVDWWLTNLMT